MHWMSWERVNQPKRKGGMGFWDLRCFNLAMLGKQGWHLISWPKSLYARIHKGSYFHDTDFMQATRKKLASSTWRAILVGREALCNMHGLIRRVLNGETIYRNMEGSMDLRSFWSPTDHNRRCWTSCSCIGFATGWLLEWRADQGSLLADWCQSYHETADW